MYRSLALLLAWQALITLSLAADWPQWQGPNRNAVSSEKGLLQESQEGGPPLAWRIEGIGGGDSAPAVVNGKLFGMSNRDGKQIVWALSEADGKELWVTLLSDAVEQRRPQSQEGPGGTPTVDGNRLYVVGMGGGVFCLRAADGEILWQRSLTEDFGGVVPSWSFRESPLVDGDKLVCTPGGPEAALVALSKTTGDTVWKSKLPAAESKETEVPARETLRRSQTQDGGRPGPARAAGGDRSRRRGGFGGRGRGGPRSGAGYSSVVAIDVDGARQYVQLTANTLVGVSAEDGKFLWRYDRPANRMGINCSTPIYQDGLVFAASAYGNGGGAVKLTRQADGKFEADEVYFTSNMQNHHGGMIVHEGCLYGANGGNGGGFLSCLDFQSGEVLWRNRDAEKGSLAFADNRLYLRTEDGEVILIEPNREKLVERGRFTQPDRTSLPAWAHPIIANGKLYIRDQNLLLCYDVAAN